MQLASASDFDVGRLLVYGGCCVGFIAVPVGLGYMIGGAMHHPVASLFGCNSKPEITGYVAPGYESVRDVFAKIMNDGMEDKVQATAFVNGKLVVNLVGIVDSQNATHDESGAKYTHSSTQNVFSSSKALSSVIVAMLVDRGLLSYDQPICEVWPEFAQQGKNMITIEDLMKHEAGMEKFAFVIDAHDLHRDSLKENKVGVKIAAAPSRRTSADPSATPERRYHFVTRDLIVNEILRRVDPKGRTLGEFLRDEIAIPMKLSEELTIGNETMLHEHKVFPLVRNSSWWVFFQIINIFERKVEAISLAVHLFLILHAPVMYKVGKWLYGPNYGNPTIVVGGGHSDHLGVHDVFNHKHMREAEAPSANGHASAYALAKVASVMALGGSGHGVKLISPHIYDLATGNVTEKEDKSLMGRTKFNRGGWSIFDTKFGYFRHGSIGWFGIGGSALQWHREARMGFGYACTLVGASLGNKNSSLVQNAVIACAMTLQKETVACNTSNSSEFDSQV